VNALERKNSRLRSQLRAQQTENRAPRSVNPAMEAQVAGMLALEPENSRLQAQLEAQKAKPSPARAAPVPAPQGAVDPAGFACECTYHDRSPTGKFAIFPPAPHLRD
jgi:hypothetical protein